MKTSPTLFVAVITCLFATLPINLQANSGDLYVSDNTNIHKITPNGTHTIITTLSRPRGLAFDKAGVLYVTVIDTAPHDNQGRVLTFASDGTFTVLATINGGEGIAFHDLTGNLYGTFTDPTGTFNASTIHRLTPSGNDKTLCTVSSDADSTHLQFAVVFDSDHNLFVADQFAYRIYMIGASGKVATYASIPGPESVAFDTNGNLYVGDGGPINGFSGNITEIAPDGTQTVFASGVGEVRSLAFDKFGYLFATGKSDNVIYKIAPNGTVSVFATGFNTPQYLVFEP
jgi:WD40 repeat protein